VREEVLRGVVSELRAGGRTVLCATHDLDVAARIADRVVVLSLGRLREVSKDEPRPEELLLEVQAS